MRATAIRLSFAVLSLLSLLSLCATEPGRAELTAPAQKPAGVAVGGDISLKAESGGIALVIGGNATLTFTQQDTTRELHEKLGVILAQLETLHSQKGKDQNRQTLLEKQLGDVQAKLLDTEAAHEQTKRSLLDAASQLESMKALIPANKYEEAFRALARNESALAEQLLMETLQQNERIIADAQKRGAEAAFRLGDIRENKHLDYAGALEHYKKASALAPNQPTYLASQGNMASKLGRYREAEDLFRQALSLLETGDENKLAMALMEAANVYWEQAKYSAADILFVRALNVRKKLAPKSFAVAETIELRALLHWKVGKIAEAEQMFKDAFYIAQDAKTTEQLIVLADLKNNWGGLNAAIDEFEAAEKLFKEALAILESVHRDQLHHPRLGNVINNLGLLHRRKHEFDDAIIYVQRARAIFVKVIGSNHPHVAVTFVNEAVARCGQNSVDAAADAIASAIRIRELSLGKDHHLYAQALAIRGRILQAQENFPDAERDFKRALDIRRSALKDDHIDIARSFYNLGALYLDWSQLPAAATHLAKAEGLLKAKSGNQSLMALVTHAQEEVVHKMEGKAGNNGYLSRKKVRHKECSA